MIVDAEVVAITGLYSKADNEANWLGWTCVETKHRKKGIGGLLLDFAIAETKREGKQYLRLYTSSHPDFAIAQRLYESRGFKIFDNKPLSGNKFSQAVNAFTLRRTRYMSLAKTHLQHVLTIMAINVVRMVAWLQGQPHAKTRRSRFAALSPAKP